jgi:tripeptide aminopeptidase
MNYLFGRNMKNRLIDRFIRYAKIDTQSSPSSGEHPSTQKQFNLAHLLVKELKEFGLDASVDENCYVMASLPANCQSDSSTIGLIAHLDTSPSVSGTDVKPRIVDSFSGDDLIINEELGINLRVSECEDLKKCIGHTLILTDGTTLLGADDKAGIVAIMAAIEQLIINPDIHHGDIKIAFTPDEEIGSGADRFDLKKFAADFAYTIDGNFTGELNMETFSADEAVIEIQGRDIHPGSAKGVMVNSLRVMADIIARLPRQMSPEKTDKYEPFIHPCDAAGCVAKSAITMILRDFNTNGLELQKEILNKIIKDVQMIYPEAKIILRTSKTYRNMRDKLEEMPHITQKLFDAAKKAGTNPYWSPIRGGTDGSKLSEMGLLTPNLFTGSGNHHSPAEWLSIDSLEKAVETILYLVTIN